MFDQQGPRPSAATVHVLAPLVQIIHATLVIEKMALLLYAVLVSVSYAVAIGCFWTLSSISGTTTGVFKSRKAHSKFAIGFVLSNQSAEENRIGAVDVNRQSDRSGIKKPNKEEKGSSLELEPETPRTFSVVNNRSELASIDASSSASSMKNFTGDRACGPGVVLNNKKMFQYRSGFELEKLRSFPIDALTED